MLNNPRNNPPKVPAAVQTAKDEIQATKQHGDLAKKIYSPTAADWYSAKPYGFTFYPRDKSSNVGITMFLPISPSNLTITTNFATNMIPTLYGTVEEHSPVRYYDITIEGTTGMGPSYGTPNQIGKSTGRKMAVLSSSSSFGGFFSQTLALFDKARNTALSVFGSDGSSVSAIAGDESGYAAFHRLYRFLLVYKQDVSGDTNSQNRTRHPLTFFNYKDANQYDVVVRNFTMRRSAENPMLYNYSIQLRGYNLRSTNAPAYTESTQDLLTNLGLDGINGSSILGSFKQYTNKAKGILGSLSGGFNVLGR